MCHYCSLCQLGSVYNPQTWKGEPVVAILIGRNQASLAMFTLLELVNLAVLASAFE